MPQATSAVESCIQQCLSCHRTCVSTVTYCLSKGGQHAEPEHITALLDCAQICDTCADFMIRGSQLHAVTCSACAEICEACAQACDRMQDDSVMKECAEACRRCAASCREMGEKRTSAAA